MDDFNLTPAELFHRLWHRKLWIVGIVVACSLLGFAYLDMAEPQFDIQANLLLDPDSRLLSVDKKQNGRFDNELTATQSEVLASWHILSRTVTAYQASNTLVPAAAEELLLRLSEELTVKPVVGTRILNVSLRWDDREQGQILAQHLIDQYQKFLLELDQGGQAEAIKTLTQTEAKIRRELVALQSEYREVCVASSLLGNADAGWALQQSLLQDLGTAYMAARSRRIGLENRMAALDVELTGPNVAKPIPKSTPNLTESRLVTAKYSSIGNQEPGHQASERAPSEQGWGALQMLNDIKLTGLQEPVAIQRELFQAEVRRQELVEKYHWKHPEVRAVENQIADWKQRLQTLVDRAPLALEREIKAVKLQEDRLRTLYDEELATAKQLDQHRLERGHLQKQIEQVETLNNSIVAQLTQLRLNNDVDSEGGADLRVTVLRSPISSADPAWPDKKLVLGGSLLMGLLGSSMLAFVPIAGQANRQATLN